ncbi:MAG: aspartate/glutamate racemase family protein [Deltaproteobacteria bacterium]|jgi:Asp/Glu/hydantoin racemase|nr:aspartate/glutamate racemase family protein [Deltaproteobacteria bacterium]
MVKKIGFVHTGVAIADMFKPMIAERLPGVSTFHIVDDSLIQDLLQKEQFTPSILKRLCNQIELAEEAGAEVIMVTCSSIAPGVDVARKMVNVPVMKVDEPMAEKAVSVSDSIGVMATAKTTMAPSVNLIKEKAAEIKKQVTIHQTLRSDAFDCFLRGDMQTHDHIVKNAATELKGKVGVIVLAQASMGHLAEAIEGIAGVPVLKSPPLAMDALVEKVKA